MLTLAVIDAEYAEPGTEVKLVWGEEDGGTAKPTVELHVEADRRRGQSGAVRRSGPHVVRARRLAFFANLSKACGMTRRAERLAVFVGSSIREPESTPKGHGMRVPQGKAGDRDGLGPRDRPRDRRASLRSGSPRARQRRRR